MVRATLRSLPAVLAATFEVVYSRTPDVDFCRFRHLNPKSVRPVPDCSSQESRSFLSRAPDLCRHFWQRKKRNQTIMTRQACKVGV